jgi:prepilin-type N-terminal cleavage/methylation domain-containing protein
MRNKGFSLIELVVVLAMMSILACMAVPRIGDLSDRQNLDYAAGQLLADLRWLQQAGINRGNQPTFSMYFYVVNPCGYKIQQGLERLKINTFPAKITCSSNYTSSGIFFQIDGTPNKPGTIFLYNGKETRQVIIDKPGRIRITR